MEDVGFEFLAMKTRLSEIEKELHSDENNTNTYLIELIEFMKDRHTHNKNCFLAGVFLSGSLGQLTWSVFREPCA